MKTLRVTPEHVIPLRTGILHTYYPTHMHKDLYIRFILHREKRRASLKHKNMILISISHISPRPVFMSKQTAPV